jgi:hypothetical protein
MEKVIPHDSHNRIVARIVCKSSTKAKKKWCKQLTHRFRFYPEAACMMKSGEEVEWNRDLSHRNMNHRD